jgi:hypothetical protein
MMKYFRENIAKLWRTSSSLVNQLKLFIASAREVLADFTAQVGLLESARRALGRVRADCAALTRSVAEMKVSAGSDAELMRQVEGNARAGGEHIARSKVFLGRVLDNMTVLRDSLNHLGAALEGFTRMAAHAAAVDRAVGDLATQAGLVKLNAAIDATSGRAGEGNYAALVEETRRIVEAAGELGRDGGGAAAMRDEKIAEFAREMETRRADLAGGLDDMKKAIEQVEIINDRSALSSSGFAQVAGHVAAVNGLIGGADARVTEFSEKLRDCETVFDKLCSDANVTLVRFNDLGTRIDAIERNLKDLEEFHRLFGIA